MVAEVVTAWECGLDLGEDRGEMSARTHDGCVGEQGERLVIN